MDVSRLRRRGRNDRRESERYRFEDRRVPYSANRLVYRLQQVDANGDAHLSGEIVLHRTVQEVHLASPYPNPVRRTATVRLAVPDRQEVAVHLYDVLGREVQTLLTESVSGWSVVELDATALAPGTYFIRMEARDTVQTRRLTVVR